MSLIGLWNSQPDAIRDKHIQQVISFAGSGRLADGNETSRELRLYLSEIPSDLLTRYASECLTTKFDHSGFALQDAINQVGKRLSFDVVDGLYVGRKGKIGFDGLWRSNGYGDILVEVKTTDAYRIDLDVLANYRTSLIREGQLNERGSSILIVVGRQDTGDLEAQIRGSRHAWDIRLISVDSLLRLMQLKETVEDANIIRKICSILIPQEFTRVDGIIDLVFSTAEDIKVAPDSVLVEDEKEVDTEPISPTRTRTQPVAFHSECVARIAEKLQTPLTKQSRSTYRSPHRDLAVSLSISKEHLQGGRVYYWFGFDPAQKEHLEQSQDAFVALGCGSEQIIFLFPLKQWVSWLPGLNQTVKQNRYYWHVYITRSSDRWIIKRKTGYEDTDITDFLI